MADPRSQAGHPLVHVDQVEGRHLRQPRLGGDGEGLSDLDGGLALDALQGVILHAVLLAVVRQRLAGRDEDVDVVAMAALPGRQLGDEIGQRPGCPEARDAKASAAIRSG